MSKHIAVVKIGYGKNTITLTSIYFKDSNHTSSFTERLRAILDMNAKTVICADTNSHSPKWFSTDFNSRGKVVEDLISDYNLNIENKVGNLCMYERPEMGSSNIDVTLSTPNMTGDIYGWTVLDDISDSDHRVITFDLIISEHENPHRNLTLKFNTKLADWHAFNKVLRQKIVLDSTKSIDGQAKSIVESLQSADKASMPMHKSKRWAKRSQPW